jgi:hypothetical protein
VVQTNVHYPTDLNLLWDGQRKCADLIKPLVERHSMEGWRKLKAWRRSLKSQMIRLTRLLSGGGVHKEQRQKEAVAAYLRDSYRFEQKVHETIQRLAAPSAVVEVMKREALNYFHTMMIQQLDLVERRLIHQEKIPHAQKVFSLFEPHTEFIKKGKLFPPVELGHKVLLTTDQNELILDYRVMEQPSDKDEVIALADRLLGRFGSRAIKSLSFDKGFTREEDRSLVELYICEVIMPKCGKRNAVEELRESGRSFQRLRRKHHAIESDINALEHHGLDRCPDKGYDGYTRYIGFGVLAYNLHKIGSRVLAERARRRRRKIGPVKSLSA